MQFNTVYNTRHFTSVRTVPALLHIDFNPDYTFWIVSSLKITPDFFPIYNPKKNHPIIQNT